MFEKLLNKGNNLVKKSKSNDSILLDMLIKNINKDEYEISFSNIYYNNSHEIYFRNLTYDKVKIVVDKFLQYCYSNNIVKIISFSYTDWSINGERYRSIEKIMIKSLSAEGLLFLTGESTFDSVYNFVCSTAFRNILYYDYDASDKFYYVDYCLRNNRNDFILNYKFDDSCLYKKSFNRNLGIKKCNGVLLNSNWAKYYCNTLGKRETYMAYDFEKVRDKLSVVYNFNRELTLRLIKKVICNNFEDILNDIYKKNTEETELFKQILLSDNFIIEQYPEILSEKFLRLYAIINRNAFQKCMNHSIVENKKKFVLEIIKHKPALWYDLAEEYSLDEDISKMAIEAAIRNEDKCLFDIVNDMNYKIEVVKKGSD